MKISANRLYKQRWHWLWNDILGYRKWKKRKNTGRQYSRVLRKSLDKLLGDKES